MDAHENAAQAVAFPTIGTGSIARLRRRRQNREALEPRHPRSHPHLSRTSDFVAALAFAPDGAKRFASASLDGNIRIWSTRSNRLQQRLYGHRARVTGLAFSPDGSLLVSSAADGQLRIWNVARGRTVKTIVGHSGGLSSVAVSPDGERIASAGEDGLVKIWATPKPATN